MCDTNYTPEEEIVLNSDPSEQYISNRLTRMQLKEMRSIHKVTQKELSEVSGLSIKCISDIENIEHGNPTLKSLIKYLDCLGYEIQFRKKE